MFKKGMQKRKQQLSKWHQKERQHGKIKQMKLNQGRILKKVEYKTEMNNKK